MTPDWSNSRRRGPPTYGLACPHCGSDAPIVYRGVVPCCTACGGVRVPLSGPSVNLAGGPSKVGGVLAGVAGWLALVVGLSFAAGLGLLVALFATPGVAWAVALPVVMISLVVGVGLIRGGRSLRRSGVQAEGAMREQALLAVAAHQGAVTAADAARALAIGVAEADESLTALAKRDPEHLNVEVDDQGVVWYRAVAPLRARVADPAGPALAAQDVPRDDTDVPPEAEDEETQARRLR
ncbi:MAG TPA: hypothetical protein VKU41_01710 [Polyangiaceae bacterium]|nr:hypothetical protein [Polyangiaceae bacterium]